MIAHVLTTPWPSHAFAWSSSSHLAALYWRKIGTKLVQIGGERLSIRQLQWFMPSTGGMVTAWAWVCRVGVDSVLVPLLPSTASQREQKCAVIHWLSQHPKDGVRQDRQNRQEKVLLYIHGPYAFYITADRPRSSPIGSNVVFQEADTCFLSRTAI